MSNQDVQLRPTQVAETESASDGDRISSLDTEASVQISDPNQSPDVPPHHVHPGGNVPSPSDTAEECVEVPSPSAVWVDLQGVATSTDHRESNGHDPTVVSEQVGQSDPDVPHGINLDQDQGIQDEQRDLGGLNGSDEVSYSFILIISPSVHVLLAFFISCYIGNVSKFLSILNFMQDLILSIFCSPPPRTNSSDIFPGPVFENKCNEFLVSLGKK